MSRGRLLQDNRGTYSFAHDAIRETVEANLGGARRAMLHRRVGQALEARGEGARPELLAYHYARGLESDKALQYLEVAADKALRTYAYDRAESQYRELAEQLEGLGRRRHAAQVQEKLGQLLLLLGKDTEAEPVLTEALAGYQSEGDLEGARRATALLGHMHHKRGEPDRTMDLLQPLALRLDSRGGPEGGPSVAAAHVWVELASVHAGQWRYGDMLHAAERAAAIARAVGDGPLLGKTLERRGEALNCLGRIPEAYQVLAEATALLENGDEPQDLLAALNNLGENRRIAGKLHEALRIDERALQIAVRTRIDRHEMLQHTSQAEILIALGEWEKAQSHLACAEQIVQVRETTAYAAPLIPYFHGSLALCRGDWDRAADQAHLALAWAAGSNRYLEEAAETLLAELELLQHHYGWAQQRIAGLLQRQEANRPRILPLQAWAYTELSQVSKGLETAWAAVQEVREREMLFYLP